VAKDEERKSWEDDVALYHTSLDLGHKMYAIIKGAGLNPAFSLKIKVFKS